MTYSTFIHSGIVNPSKPKLKEQSDSVDTITMDIPLLTRILELAREDVKDDAQLHELLTKIIDIKNRGTLTMNDYEEIIGNSERNDELDSIKKLAGI